MATGENVVVVSYKESTFRTAPTTPNGLKWPIVSCGLKESGGRGSTDPILSNNRNETRSSQGRRNRTGPIVIRPTSRDLPFIMPDLMGPVTSAVDGALNKHTAKVGALGTGLSIDVQSLDLTGTGSVLRYLGSRAMDWSFSCSDEGFLQLTVNVIAADMVEDDELLDAAPKYYGGQGFDMFGLTVEEGGAPMTIAKDFQLTVANNIDGEYGRTIGTAGALSELPEGKIGVTFNYNALFKSRALIDKARNNQLSSFALNFAHSISGHYAKFKMNEIEYEIDEPTAEGPNGRVLNMKGRAILEADVAASSLIFENVNDIASVATYPA